MRTIVLLLAAALAISLAIPGQAGHGAQMGTNGDCLDYNALYLVDGVVSPGAAQVAAHGGSFTIGAGSGTAYVDFFDANGVWLGYNNGASSGVAPAGTAFAIVCVGLLGEYPDAPVPAESFTFSQ